MVDLFGLKCCCIENINIASKNLKTGSKSFGHTVTVTINLSQDNASNGGKNCGCSLEWWEWSTDMAHLPKVMNVSENKWEELLTEERKKANPYLVSNTFSNWYKGKDGNALITIIDPPSLAIVTTDLISGIDTYHRSASRQLYIKAIVKSGPDCICKNPEEGVYFEQLLETDADANIKTQYGNPTKTLPATFPK